MRESDRLGIAKSWWDDERGWTCDDGTGGTSVLSWYEPGVSSDGLPVSSCPTLFSLSTTVFDELGDVIVSSSESEL